MNETTAVYPGSFDPLTRGHEDIIRRGLRLVDRLVVAVAETATQGKDSLFSIPEREDLIRTVFREEPRVEVTSFSGLLVDFARERGARLILRGLRAVSDFEYEFQMVGMNRSLNDDVEMVFLMADAKNQAIASKLVKEIARLGGDIEGFVPPMVAEALLERFRDARENHRKARTPR